MKKNIILSFMFIVLSLMLTGCTISNAKVLFADTTYTYFVSDEVSLADILILENLNPSELEINYVSSNESVAIIENDTIFCLSQGTAVITGKIQNIKHTDISLNLTVLSRAKYAEAIEASDNIVLKLGEPEYFLNASLVPSSATVSLNLTSLNTEIVTVSAGFIYPVGLGQTQILCKALSSTNEYVTKLVNVTVEEIISFDLTDNLNLLSESTFDLHSGLKASGEHEIYTLSFTSNFDLTEKEIDLYFYDTTEQDLSEIIEVVGTDYSSDGKTLYLHYYLNSYSGSFKISAEVFENAQNYVSTFSEFDTEFIVSEYISSIDFVLTYLNGENSSKLETINGVYTLYNIDTTDEMSYSAAINDGKVAFATCDITTNSTNEFSVVIDSSDVILYESGTVYAVAAGLTTLTVNATDGSGAQAIFNFAVEDVSVTAFDLTFTEYSLFVGGNDENIYPSNISIATNNILPIYSTDKTAHYVSSNSNIISVDSSGNINALSAGSAYVTVTIGSVIKTVDITVSKAFTYTITVSKTSVNLASGKSTNITFAILKNGVACSENNIIIQTLISGEITNVSSYLTYGLMFTNLTIFAHSYTASTIIVRIICGADTSVYMDIPVTILVA